MNIVLLNIEITSFFVPSSWRRTRVLFLPKGIRRLFLTVQVLSWCKRIISMFRIGRQVFARLFWSFSCRQLLLELFLTSCRQLWLLFLFCWRCWRRSGWRTTERREWHRFGQCSSWREYWFWPTRCWMRCRQRWGFWFFWWRLLMPSWSCLLWVWGLWTCSCLLWFWLYGFWLRQRRVWCWRLVWLFSKHVSSCGLAFCLLSVFACVLNLCWYPFTMWLI